MSSPSILNDSTFARYNDLIELLYENDENFKILCDDYVISKNHIEKYKQNVLNSLLTGQEFERLSNDLEKEILSYLEKMR